MTNPLPAAQSSAPVIAAEREPSRTLPAALGWLALGVVYLFAALWLIRPVLADPATLLPGWSGDNYYFLWQITWFRQAVLAGHSPFFAPQIFYPEGFYLARDDMTFLNTLPAALIGGLTGDVLAYNLMLVVSSVLSGLCMALWVRRLTGSLVAAGIAGLAFVLLPFRAIRMAGHLDLVTTWPIPLTLFFLDRALDTGRPRDYALTGVGFALAALGAWYFAPLFALVLPCYWLVRGGPVRRWRRWPNWRGVAVFGVTAAALLILPALPYFTVPSEGGLQHLIGEAIKGSASPTDYVMPSVLHPLFGAFAQGYFANSEFGALERAVSPGLVVLVLALAAMFVCRDRLTAALTVLALVAFIFSLGPSLQWAGRGVQVPWPRSLGLVFTSISPELNDYIGQVGVMAMRTGTGFVPLPALAAAMLLPLGRAIRGWSRLGIFVDVALIALAGIALAALFRRWRFAAPAVALLVLVELATITLPAVPAAPRPVDLWLRANGDSSPIALLPVSAASEPREVHATLDHGQSIVFGHATFPPKAYRDERPTLLTFPSPESLAVLRGWGVRRVVVLPEAFGTDWPAFAAKLQGSTDIKLAARLDGAEVWELR